MINYNLNKKSTPIDIQKQFNLIANEYDKNRRKFIPCFDDFDGKIIKPMCTHEER